ncbi:beta-ketoacyl-[acyl-carrier-protein] synthase family protein [Solitalea longa]|uniref:Beta-ketoacyl-[acyl-carrier-protein] synthase family protein n=1 Tax=Solitalea longa TaxID=2079460 RepID=A0A2S5A1S1_9SPHI|nr:beta-ketoacyl-[acyl-carrier-protein] synthase family protein [Solitalea longa]POY36548.1 beta-ketoacyl-[acyl-carrier-protein] synthase family protein [Solitalea longa]
MTEVYVAGLGIISAIGTSVNETLSSFEQHRTGIDDIRFLDTIYRGQLPVAEVKLSNDQLSALSGLPENVSRTALLSTVAAKEAWVDAGIGSPSKFRTGFISANSVGGMDKSENFFIDFLKDAGSGDLNDVKHHECGSITELTADSLGISDHISTISTACSSSANAIFMAARLIKHNLLDVVVAGGCDSMAKFTLNGFNTLQILDEEHCKPFDENRRGLNLGEGAGYVVLVSEKVVQQLHKKPYCKLSGYNNANDAYHQTASSPDGTGSYLAMKGALEKAGLQPEDIDYINLHGTGTQNNDHAESTAISRLFSSKVPKMSSTKSFTGHTLGASGAIEAVLSVLAIEKEIIYPNANHTTTMKEFGYTPVKVFLKNQQVKHVLSNSFGFGGNCSSLIFSKI